MENPQTILNFLNDLASDNGAKHVLEQFISDYLSKNGLYHVYFRQADPCLGGHSQKDITLLKTFIDNESALKWVIENGRSIVEEQEDNYADNRIVLTIIHHDNIGNYCAGDEPNHFYNICDKMYPSFAFSPNGYKLLLEENLENNHFIWSDNSNLHWINYHKNDGTHVVGCSIDELKMIEDTEYLVKFYEKCNTTPVMKTVIDEQSINFVPK